MWKLCSPKRMMESQDLLVMANNWLLLAALKSFPHPSGGQRGRDEITFALDFHTKHHVYWQKRTSNQISIFYLLMMGNGDLPNLLAVVDGRISNYEIMCPSEVWYNYGRGSQVHNHNQTYWLTKYRWYDCMPFERLWTNAHTLASHSTSTYLNTLKQG